MLHGELYAQLGVLQGLVDLDIQALHDVCGYDCCAAGRFRFSARLFLLLSKLAHIAAMPGSGVSPVWRVKSPLKVARP